MSNLLHVAVAVQPEVLPFAVGRPPRRRAPRGGLTISGRFYRGGTFLPGDLPTVEIRGAAYLAERLDAGECGVSAVRLTKLATGESYDLVRRHDDTIECDCGDYEFRRRGTGEPCKHGAACMAHGLLPVGPAAAPGAGAEEEGPAWTWDAWTDADTWELGPDPAEGPSPSWDAEPYEPDPVSAAYQLGYELGLAGEYPETPAHLPGRERRHFAAGRLAGFLASPDGRAWCGDLESGGGRADAVDVHDAERLGIC